MLEICISGFLVVSAPVSILLWQALVAAKRADYGLHGMDDVYMLAPAVPSGDD